MLRVVKSVVMRHKLVLILVGIVLILLHLTRELGLIEDLDFSGRPFSKPPQPHSYASFFNLHEYAPSSPSLKNNYITEKANEKFVSSDFLFSKEYLENVLNVTETGFTDLKSKHTKYMKSMNKKKMASFTNLTPQDKEWSDYVGSSGYVLIGGGKFSWLSYLVIKQLRQSGATLPIELFIPTKEEHEPEFCELIQSKYNARCNVVDETLTTLMKEYNIKGYQYKMLAILSSKFESLLYIDSDNYPTRNPDFLFESKVFKETGLIFWPDFWARTTNPKFYDIAGKKYKENKIRINEYDKKMNQVEKANTLKYTEAFFHTFEGTIPDPTIETGMMLINKTLHLKTMLLSLYYNVYGPDYYYPLLTQGSAGEGDKETFIAAAHVLDKPYYVTKFGAGWVGYHNEEKGEFTAKALNHFDPVESSQEGFDEKKRKTLFLHLSYPKFYIEMLYDNNDLVYKESRKHIRMYPGIYKNLGYDFDLRVLQSFTEGACPNYYVDGTSVDGDGIRESEYMADYLTYVKHDEEKNVARCEEVYIPHLKWLKETTEF